MYSSVPESVPDIVPDAPDEVRLQTHGPRKPGEPEIQNLQHAVFAKDDVLRLDVAMEYPFSVRRSHSASRLSTPIDGLRAIHRPGVDQLTKRRDHRSIPSR